MHQRLAVPAWNITFADILVKTVLQLERFAQVRRREGSNILKKAADVAFDRVWWNQADIAELCERVSGPHVMSSGALGGKIGCILAETTRWTVANIRSASELSGMVEPRLKLVQRLEATLERTHAESSSNRRRVGRPEWTIMMDMLVDSAQNSEAAQVSHFDP